MVLVQMHEVEKTNNLSVDSSIINIFISMISKTAWDGLQKPVTTFSSDHILKCGILCTAIPGDCDTFHYDFWHQRCTVAKVGIPSPLCRVIMSQLYLNRLTALPQLIRSVTRERLKETVPALLREKLGSTFSIKLIIVSMYM